ncbi:MULTISPECIES: hypothetical protein [Bacillus]|uniref:hypothetical protein n=1 Tax=Bacillus TaxID=1386 RepID=UPI0002E12DC6|nr:MULTISPECIES: hypothetical protein [Bacillus]
MIDFRKISLDESTDTLSQISNVKTTYFSVNPYLDNVNLIKKKLVQKNINVYNAYIENQIVGVFLIEIIDFTDDLAVIDFLCLKDNVLESDILIVEFLDIIHDIYNIGNFIKFEEINDERLSSFQKIGFCEIANLNNHLFYDGVFHNQRLYFIDWREAG